MLRGPLKGKVFRFALPLALTGVLQQLFNAADVAVVGRFAGKNAMAAVGANTAVVGLMITMFIGISIGANVVIAIAIGNGSARESAMLSIQHCFLRYSAGLGFLLLEKQWHRHS